jgi:transposase
LPASVVDELIDHWPAHCGCGHVFVEGDRVAVREPARHQVEELPQIAVSVTEHRCQRVRCPGCGAERTGELPDEVAGSAFGPRLQAAVATLSVRNRVSRRDLVELCEELFGARISVGSIDAILARTADALEQPYEQLLCRMRRSRAVNVDETGWRLKGGQRTLWGAFTEKIAVFKVTASRHEQHLRELLADHQGIVTSDRRWAYDHLPLARREICWSHLQRDFQAQAEGSGAEHELGTAGLRICERLF